MPTYEENLATRLEGIPNFVAVRKDQNYFIPFETEPKIENNLLFLKENQIQNLNNSCFKALFENSPPDIHSSCKTTLIPDGIRPKIQRISGSSVFVNTNQNLFSCVRTRVY